jgi:hypothetical protein
LPFPVAADGSSTPTPVSVDEQAVTHFEPIAPQSSTLASLGLVGGTTPAPTAFVPHVEVIEVPSATRTPPAAASATGASTRRGVAALWVVVLVLLALAAGFAMGFEYSRMM